jgi:hypothetical protein
MDTSGSMAGYGATLRDDHWDRIHPRFVDLPLRYVAFSGRSEQETQSDWLKHSRQDLASMRPRNFGNGTYLWGLIVEEAQEMIDRGLPPEEVLIYVVTDGMDNESSGLLYGPPGIGGCIDELNHMGFPAEFWIVGIRLAQHDAAEYQKFANRSGGQFFQLDDGMEEEVESQIDSIIQLKQNDPGDWKKQRLQIIRDYLHHNPSDSVLNLDGQDSLYALRSIIPSDQEDLKEIGTKADAALISLQLMGPGRNRRTHLWILLRKETYDALDDVRRDALAREISSFSGNGQAHLVLVDFTPPLSSGILAGKGSSVLPDLLHWAGEGIDELIEAIVDYGTSRDSDKVRIGTLEGFRIENRFPLPNQPWVVLNPEGNFITNAPSSLSASEYSNADWNAVPGPPVDDCRNGLVVTPYLNCGQGWRPAGSGKQSKAVWEFNRCINDANAWEWNIPTPYERLPAPSNNGESPVHADAWSPGQDCFILILEEALAHIENCWKSHHMNHQVVIELTQLGRLIGLHNHPALQCFEEAVRQISPVIRIRHSYSKVNGLY